MGLYVYGGVGVDFVGTEVSLGPNKLSFVEEDVGPGDGREDGRGCVVAVEVRWADESNTHSSSREAHQWAQHSWIVSNG